jgi:hypothetical protein
MKEDKKKDLLDDLMPDVMLHGCLEAVVMFIVFLLLILLFGSCKSVKYVPVIEHHTDTCYITKHQRDSIWLHDSIHVKEKQQGDTIWLELEKWHTKYVESRTHDTIYISTHDTIPQPYPVEVIKKVEKPLSWWQKLLQRSGAIALAALLVWMVWQGAKIYMRRY